MSWFETISHAKSFLDAQDWLGLRLVNKELASCVESLCDNHEVMMRLGRRLGGDVSKVKPLNYRITKANRWILLDWLRKMLKTEDKLDVLERYVPNLRLTRDEALYVTDGQYDSIVDAYAHPNLIELVSDERLLEFAKDDNTQFAELLYDRGLEEWNAYIDYIKEEDEFVISCPKRAPRAKHVEFIQKFINMTKSIRRRKCVPISWEDICPECIGSVLKIAPDKDLRAFFRDAATDDYLFNAFVENIGNLDTERFKKWRDFNRLAKRI